MFLSTQVNRFPFVVVLLLALGIALAGPGGAAASETINPVPVTADLSLPSAAAAPATTLAPAPVREVLPSLELWMRPDPQGIGYCYDTCEPCRNELDCGGYPCTSVPAC